MKEPKESIGEKATDLLDWIEENWFRVLWIVIIGGIVISTFKDCILSLF